MTAPPARTPAAPVELLEVAIALTTVAVALGTLLTFFDGLLWLLPVLGGLVLGAGLVLLFRLRGWPSWALGPVAVAVTLVYQLFALHWSSTTFGLPGPDALRALRDGVFSGWARMLTTALPADPTGDLLALPTALAVAAGVVVALLVLGTRSAIAPAAVPVAVLVVGLLLAAAGTGPALRGPAVTALVVALLLLLLLLRTNRLSASDDGIAETDAGTVGIDLAARRRHSTAARVLIGLPAAVVVLVLATTGALVLPIASGEDRADPRDLYRPEVELTARLSPLVEVRPQLSLDPPVPLYRVTVPDDAGDLMTVRIAALDRFDGALWSQSGRFVHAGSRLPVPDDLPATGDEVTLAVEVLDPQTSLLPVVGVPVRAEGAAVAVDVDGGNLLALARLAPGTPDVRAAGARAATDRISYRVTGRVIAPEGADEAAIVPGSERYTVLPDPPTWVREAADEVVDGRTTVWTQLQAIEKALWDSPYSLQARPGQSYGAINRVLLGGERDRFGYAEQHSSAFAVLARSLGYPTRIAVGYRLDDTRREGRTYTVTTADAHAWPEVLLEGHGWVPFEPTNPAADAGAPPPQAEDIPPLPDDATAPERAEPDDTGAVGATEGRPLLEQAGIVGLVVLLSVLALLVAVGLCVVAAKVLRRRRRQSTGTPSRRIAGAWQEAVDRLREAGQPVPSWQTPVETARAAATRSPSPPWLEAAVPHLTELALIATSAVCSPTAPTSVAARRAWKLQGQAAAALAGRQGVPARVRSVLDPRPLLPGAGRLRRDDPAPSPGSPDPASVPAPEDPSGSTPAVPSSRA